MAHYDLCLLHNANDIGEQNLTLFLAKSLSPEIKCIAVQIDTRNTDVLSVVARSTWVGFLALRNHDLERWTSEIKRLSRCQGGLNPCKVVACCSLLVNLSDVDRRFTTVQIGDVNRLRWCKDLKEQILRIRVFVVYNHDDEKIGNNLCDQLNDENFKVISHHNFEPNRGILKGRVNALKKAHIILMILTDTAVTGRWVPLEMIKALEQSMRQQRLVLRIVKYRVDQSHDEVANLLASCVPHLQQDNVCVDGNDTARLAKSLRELCSLTEWLPCGSVAYAMAISHCFGYHFYVAGGNKTFIIRGITEKDLDEILAKDPLTEEEMKRFSGKFYLILPTSCLVRETLETDIKTPIGRIIINEFRTIPFDKCHVGTDRHYSLTIYKMTKMSDASTVKTFYFCGMIPYSLNAIGKMGLTIENKMIEYKRTLYAYQTLVNLSELSGKCKSGTAIVECDDSTGTDEDNNKAFFTAMYETLEKDVDGIGAPHKRQVPPSQFGTPDVLLYAGEEDRNLEGHISKYLEYHEKHVVVPAANIPRLSTIESKWTCMIISKRTWQSDNLLKFYCQCHIQRAVDENRTQVIVILTGDVDISELPEFIKWVTVVQTTNKKYLETLLHVVNGEPITMTERLPHMNIAIGLARAYSLNFLEILLDPEEEFKDLRGRINRFNSSDGQSRRCLMKFFVFFPRNCNTSIELKDAINRSRHGSNVSKEVKHLGKLDPITRNTGGQMNRKFTANVYQYTDPDNSDNDVCFLAEYCAVSGLFFTLANEENYFGCTGFDQQQMHKQGEMFVNEIRNVLEKQGCESSGTMRLRDVVKFIYYDEHEPLMDILLSDRCLDIDHIKELMFEHTDEA